MGLSPWQSLRLVKKLSVLVRATLWRENQNDIVEYSFQDEAGDEYCEECDGNGFLLLNDVSEVEPSDNGEAELLGNDIELFFYYKTADQSYDSAEMFVLCHSCDGVGEYIS